MCVLRLILPKSRVVGRVLFFTIFRSRPVRRTQTVHPDLQVRDGDRESETLDIFSNFLSPLTLNEGQETKRKVLTPRLHFD